ncbi:MAG: alpha/beta hydrolase [Chloroflexi bacterium]|nr:alpha/beta hydrolase [Chloroflexota bacterium]MDA1240811.1 alpha/beta hydrolase [Chloroflexota bacterium]
MAEPTQHFFESQRVRIAYWDWGNSDAPPMVLVHGGKDHARAWDGIAEALSDTYHVVALDLRGHGDSEWTIGGTYGLPDNALDVVKLIDLVGAPARVLGHSYGGSVSLIAAGTFPEHFASLAVIEGTHSLNPSEPQEMGPRWLRQWGDRVRSYESSTPRVYPDLAAAEERVRDANPKLPLDLSPHLTRWAARPVEGGYVWKYDWWVNGRTSMEIRKDELERFWAAVECPTLHLFARQSNSRQRPDAGKYFRDARTAWIEDAGHWAHHEQPEAVLAALRPFFAAHPAE